MISRQSSVTRRRALVGASSLVALPVLPSLPASGAIPALFAQWEAAYAPYLAALKEYSRVEGIFFADKTPENEKARDHAAAAMDALEDTVNDLEERIFEAPAVTLADVRCKLLVRSKTIGYGDGDIEGAGGHDHELLVRLLADVERLAGKAVQS
jgi:hypothetical protein